ncbi:MAG TPA: hypothetical protein VK483_17875 [Chitinophagaceae bacterium]|nr:hypothetical protein [Chitinophagaceae bacterium]
MKNNSIQQTSVVRKTVNMLPVNAPRLSDDAFYLMTLVSQLKKMLGPFSLPHFLETGEFVTPAKKAS